MATKKRTTKTAEKQEGFVCPLCFVAACLKNMADRNSPFFEHMNNARIEVLEGIKAAIDTHIEAVKKSTGGKKSKLTKIKVEE